MALAEVIIVGNLFRLRKESALTPPSENGDAKVCDSEKSLSLIFVKQE
jgi:hypothetical protein